MNCWQAVAGWCRGRVVLLSIRSRQGGCGFRFAQVVGSNPAAARLSPLRIRTDRGCWVVCALRGPKNATTRVVSTRVDVYCDVKCGLRGTTTLKIRTPRSSFLFFSGFFFLLFACGEKTRLGACFLVEVT